MPDKKTAPRRDLNIRDRVVELRRVARGDVLPNPNNFRTHPEGQREALRGILKEVGIAGAGLAYHSERNGGRLTFIDGHLRDEEITEQFPVLVTDLNDAEADLLLATYDPLAAMAGAGSTMAAGEQTERAVYTNEISPEWCAVTLERMTLLGLMPELVNG